MSTRAFAAALAPVLLSLGLATGAVALTDADRTFMLKAAQDGIAEMELGKLAQERGASARVKQLGSRVATGHRKSHEELRSLARRKHVSLPSALDREHAARAEELKRLSGAAFDLEYAKGMVQGHRHAVAEFEKAAKGAADADVKAFAARQLPVLKRHLALALSTEAAVSR
jgi:putative membrane protein